MSERPGQRLVRDADIGPGLLRKIIRDTGIDILELFSH
jgi:hypothetical protein